MFKSILLFLLLPILVIASEPSLEELLEQYDDNSDISEHISEIEELVDTPIYVDASNLEEIDKLICINQFQKDLLKDIIKESKFTKEYLLSTGRFKEYEIELLLLCVRLEEEQTDKTIINASYRGRYKNKLMQIRGYEPEENKGKAKYEGSKFNFYQKIHNSYIFDSSEVNIGIVTDKDAGENLAFDYYSLHASYEDDSYQIIAGDYYLKRGSGLILASGFAPRKSTEVISGIYSYDYSHRPYTSTLESRRMRGFSAKTNMLSNLLGIDLSLDIFYSNQAKSGNIKTDAEDNGYISSIYQSGFYRSDTELEKKDAFKETLAGGGFELDLNYVKLTGTALYVDYSLPLLSGSSSAFYGKYGLLNSLSLDAGKWDNLKFSSEFAADANNNTAFIFGAIGKSSIAQFAFNLRNYSKGFRSPFGNAFGEFSYPSNEKGIYVGVKTIRFYKTIISAYLDIFSSQDSTYYVPSQVKGYEYLGNLEYLLLRKNYLEFQFKCEKKTDYGKIGNREFKEFYDARKSKYKMQYKGEYKFAACNLRLKTGLQYSALQIPENTSSGFGYYISTKLDTDFGLDLGISFTEFDTDDYDSAIWFYEYAIPGYSNILALYLKGYRVSTFIAYNLNSFTLSARFTYLEKPDEKTLSSGWDETFSPIDKRIYLQLDWKL